MLLAALEYGYSLVCRSSAAAAAAAAGCIHRTEVVVVLSGVLEVAAVVCSRSEVDPHQGRIFQKALTYLCREPPVEATHSWSTLVLSS